MQLTKNYSKILDCPAGVDRFEEIKRNTAHQIWRFVNIFAYTKIWVLNRMGCFEQATEVKRKLIQKKPIFLNQMIHILTLMREIVYVPDYDTAEFAAKMLIHYGEKFDLLHYHAMGYLFKGTIQYRTGNYEQAVDNIQTALELSCKNRDLRGIVMVLFAIAQIHYSQNEMSKAIVLFRKCIEREKDLGDFDSLLSTYSELSAAYIALGEYRPARSLITFCLKHEKRLNQDNMAFLYYDLSELELMTGNLEASEDALNKCAQSALNTGNTVMHFAALSLHSKLKEYEGDIEEAIALLKESIRVQEELESTEILIDSMCQLAHLYVLNNKLDLAEDTVRRIEENPVIGTKDEFEVLKQYTIAEIAQARDNHQRTLEILAEIYPECLELDDTLMSSLIQLTRLESFIAINHFEEAEVESEQLIKRAIENGARVLEIRGRIIQSALYLRGHNFVEAKIASERAIEEASIAGFELFADDAHDILERIDNMESAMSHYDQVDRIQSEEKKDEISIEDIKAYIVRAKSIASAVES